MHGLFRALTVCLALPLVAGCFARSASAPVPSVNLLSVADPPRRVGADERPLAYNEGEGIGAYDGYTYTSRILGDTVVSMSVFNISNVGVSGRGSFLGHGKGIGWELGITGEDIKPSAAIASVYILDHNIQGTGDAVQYFLLAGGVRLALIERLGNVQVVPTLTLGFSYHSLDSVGNKDDLWGGGVFGALGIWWLASARLAFGAEVQAHYWLPDKEEGRDATTVLLNAGITMFF